MTDSTPWTIEPHSGADKSFSLIGPGELRLEVDYDDVDHDAVDAAVLVVVELLNKYADRIMRAEASRFPVTSSSGDRLELGDPRVNQHSGVCCGKPVGCTMLHDGCLFLRHPWKLAHIRDLENASGGEPDYIVKHSLRHA